MFCVVPAEQVRSQVELLQLTEQLLPQVTWQVAPLSHETLPLLPTVTVHVEASQLNEALSPPVNVHWESLQLRDALSPAVMVQMLPPSQLPLQDPPQVPLQTLSSRQSNVQLPPLPSHPVTALAAHVQSAPASQVHADPAHSQPGPGQTLATLSSPQARGRVTANSVVRTVFCMGSPTNGWDGYSWGSTGIVAP